MLAELRVSNELISTLSLLISVGALGFSVSSWRQTNRPFVAARVMTHKAGNMAIVLNILVENSGTQPACDVCLLADKNKVTAAHLQSRIPADADRCFFSDIRIPLIANGSHVSNAFWHLGKDDSWRTGAVIPLTIKYSGLDGRKFTSKMNLLLADDSGFAQTHWS